jgi:hypothetical protein
MSILWAGGEDISFMQGVLTSINTSGFRSGYARCSLNIPRGAGGACKGNPFTPITSGWITFRQQSTVGGVSGFLGGFGQSTSAKCLGISYGGTGYQTALTLYNGTTWTTLATEAGVSLTTAIQKFDIQLINYGTTATVNVWVDGVQVISFAGNVSISGVTGFDSTFFGPQGSGTGGYNNFSEVIVADEDTRNFSLVTQAPTALGTTDQWTGAYTDVNEITLNDGTDAYTSTANQDEQFAVNSLPTGAFSIKAVMAAARATKSSTSTIGTLKLGWNIGGTVNVYAGHTLAIQERIAMQNPITSNIWQTSEVNGLQIDLQSAT